MDCEWPELREALKVCWRGATRLSNWAVRQLALAGRERMPDDVKITKPPKVYLYPGARAIAPELDSGSLVAIIHAVEQRYRKRRYETHWLCSASLPNYRYPAPYPVRSQDWSAEYGKDNIPLVSVRLAGTRLKLRLRGGHEFRRQLTAFWQLIEGQAVASELSLYEQRANGSDHRNGTAGKDSGGAKAFSRLMCKLVLWLPRGPKADAEGTLHVRTDKDALLIALDAKDERVWVLNADQVRRWSAEHVRRLSRWSDDQKAEQRPVAAFQSRREAATVKYRRRMDSTCHESAAQLVNFAKRRRFAMIRYDDGEHGFCERFPWEQLRRLIAEKADAAGIEFERSGGEKTTGTTRVDVTVGE